MSQWMTEVKGSNVKQHKEPKEFSSEELKDDIDTSAKCVQTINQGSDTHIVPSN